MKKKEENFVTLRPRARIIRTLGDELISNETVAVIELVKNSYDADAKQVFIKFSGSLEKGKGKIEIVDDGTGMTLETVKSAWLEPATVSKISKTKRRTPLGRPILGEKGVGRFAAAKLSNKLVMVTKTKSSTNEIAVTFDWGDFSSDKYLDQVMCSWEERTPDFIQNQGTVLKMEKLNVDWDDKKLQQLRSSLSRLLSPFAPIKNFEIYLELPDEYKRLSGKVDAPELLKHPHYSIKGDVFQDGRCELKYSTLTKKGKIGNITDKLFKNENRLPVCGPFKVELRVWDRDPEKLEELAEKFGSSFSDIRRDLNEAAGISVYRDGFRVLPYGEKDNDWLRLDFRRVQNPTMRLSNNQIVGYILISAQENSELKDQSNREGIIDSEAFADFKQLVIEAIALLEQNRFKERPRKKKDDDQSGLLSGISVEPLRKVIEERLPHDAEAQKIAKETDEIIKQKVEKVREVLARYRRLATLGQLIDVVLHEGHSAVNKIDSEILLVEEQLYRDKIMNQRLSKGLKLVKNEANLLSTLFKRIEPFGGRRRGTPKRFNLASAIENVFGIFEKEMTNLKVNAILPKGQIHITMDESEFQEIIVNLLTNSLFWLSSQPESDRKIAIETEESESGLSILFCDNGPGVKAENLEHIFEPYFSTKPDGVGLGLTIAGELVDEYGGTLELLNDGPLKGACFRIFFPKKEAKGVFA